jgi:hypothetical protein
MTVLVLGVLFCVIELLAMFAFQSHTWMSFRLNLFGLATELNLRYLLAFSGIMCFIGSVFALDRPKVSFTILLSSLLVYGSLVLGLYLRFRDSIIAERNWMPSPLFDIELAAWFSVLPLILVLLTLITMLRLSKTKAVA